MKYLHCLIGLGLLMLSACMNESNNTQTELNMKQLHWLIGEWQRTNEVPERVSLELWELQEDGHLAGVGLTTEGDKVVFKEQLKLQIEGDKVQYVAIVPHNNQPTIFELTSLQENAVVFENPEHDFPKKISYELITANSMQAIISGNGKEIVFSFKRLQ